MLTLCLWRVRNGIRMPQTERLLDAAVFSDTFPPNPNCSVVPHTSFGYDQSMQPSGQIYADQVYVGQPAA